MPSELSRRRLLGGVAAAGAATYSGYRFLPADLLPAPLLELRTKRRSIPAVETALPVAPEAVADARDHLREVIGRAEAAWSEVDDADVDGEQEEFDRGLESSVDLAREQFDETEGADPTTATLRELRFGVHRAAWSLAAARAITEDYDHATLLERSRTLADDIEAFADGVSYEVADPRRGLAYLFRAERAVHFARMKADNVPDADADQSTAEDASEAPDEDESQPELSHDAAVSAIESLIEGRRWLGDARAIYDTHRSQVADARNTTDLRDHLDRTWRTLADRIDDSLPDRETAVERYFPEPDEGPHYRAVNELFNNGYMAADDARPPTGDLRDGLLALAAVEHAESLQHALGFRSAVKRLDAAFADGGVGMARAARTKREAITRLRDLLADADDPVTRELADRPREEVVIGDWPLGVDPTFESEHPHAEAYAMYLLASENLRHTPEVRRALLP